KTTNILRDIRIILVILPEHQSDTKVLTMTMKILPEPTSNKLCGRYEHVAMNLNTSTSSCCHHREYLQGFAAALAILITGASQSRITILHLDFLQSIIKSRPNIVECTITKLVDFINTHQSVLLFLIMIYESSRIGSLSSFLRTVIHFKCLYNGNDSASRVDITSRLSVDRISIELLTFSPPVRDASEYFFKEIFKFHQTLARAFHQVEC
nr:hypothetical protein [Tanacetum cinerariifolium]